MLACLSRMSTQPCSSRLIVSRRSECWNKAPRMLMMSSSSNLEGSKRGDNEAGCAPLALIFDTETNGRHDFKKEAADTSQPALVQLGMILVDTATWTPKLRTCMLIQEVSFMEEEAQKIHGISVQDCQRYGVPQVMACQQFQHLLSLADCLVAHNLNFDERVMNTAIHRSCLPQMDPALLDNLQTICTMKASTDIVGIPASFGKSGAYKWPTLAEAFEHFTSCDLENGGHDAMVDAEACLTVFRSLVESGVVQLRKRVGDKDQEIAHEILKRGQIDPKSSPATGHVYSSNADLSPDIDGAIAKPGELWITLDPTTSENEHNGFRITGNTYKYRQQIRALGECEWDRTARAWIFPDRSRLSAAQQLTGSMPLSPYAAKPEATAAASVETGEGDPWKKLFDY